MAEPNNHRDLLIAGAVGLFGGLGAGVATMAGPQAYPMVASWVWALIMWSGIAVFIGAIAYLLYEYWFRPKRVGKPRLDPLVTIAFVAALVLAGALLLLLIRGPDVAQAVGSPAATAVRSEQSKIVESVDIRLGFGERGRNADLLFSARALKRGEKLDIFLDFTTVGNSYDIMSVQNLRMLLNAPRRILISTIERYAPKQEIDVVIGRTYVDNSTMLSLRISGKERENSAPITSAHFIGSVVLIANDGATESHRFMIVSRAGPYESTPIVIGPNVISSLNQW